MCFCFPSATASCETHCCVRIWSSCALDVVSSSNINIVLKLDLIGHLMLWIFQPLGSLWDGSELPGRCLQKRPEPGHHLCDVHWYGLSVLQVSQRHPASLRLSHRTHRVLQRAGCTHGGSHCGQVDLSVPMGNWDGGEEKHQTWILISDHLLQGGSSL